MVASVLPLPERLTLQGARSHLRGAECLQVLAIAGMAPLNWLCKVCTVMYFPSILGRGFHKLEGLTTLSQLSS